MWLTLGVNHGLRAGHRFLVRHVRAEVAQTLGRLGTHQRVIIAAIENIMHVTVRNIGDSQGVVIPKSLLAQLGWGGGVAEMTVEHGALVLRKLAKPSRAEWAAAAQKISQQGDDALVMGQFGNAGDAGLAW